MKTSLLEQSRICSLAVAIGLLLVDTAVAQQSELRESAGTVSQRARVSAARPTDRWMQSYNAGYIDENGAYAGGSEIMHLVAHRGKLYAANGYWVDSHWVIPPDDQKQSAQVLRLDSSDGQWQVDLDCGKGNEFGLTYMKGNILKSVTFTRDLTGQLLQQPHQLLVMGSGAWFEGGGAVSVWVRDDKKEKWNHTLVRHGANPGGVRWVPRDMEVYTDKVTGQERLFLLLGNPGIISGVYDPADPSKIRWDRHTEYPFLQRGKLDIRPLGLAQANGKLYFSAGASIYQRHDGLRPSYTEVLDLLDDTDTDVGGIRGITTIKNPSGPGESLLFLWAPGGRSRSQVVRLDPDRRGGFSRHNEASMMDLMEERLGVEVSYTLGAHNMMYPVKHPVTGQTVHIIGFQGNILGRPHLRWKGSRLYAGAMYAIRTPDQQYTVQEVNNEYAPGKALLISPRAFCHSPFGDGQLFVGGHDASNKVSDDMAWIFKTPLEVALGLRPGLDAHPPKPKPKPAARLTQGPVYELRIYRAKLGRYPLLVRRFREHTDGLFKKHGLEPVGYWTPSDKRSYKRTFVYLLKHPSRYAAFKNWVRFFNDRQWQDVLDKPEFQGLLSERPESIFLTENGYSELAQATIDKPGGIYELRTYVANLGKLPALNAHFRDTATRLLAKHGIRSIGFWAPFDQPDSQDILVMLLYHTSGDGADAGWKALESDPAWQTVWKKSPAEEGKLLASPAKSLYLRAREFSRLK